MLFQHKANGSIFLWTIVAIPLKTFSEKNLSVWFSAPKLLEHFLQFVLALSKTFLDSNATLELRFTQHSYLKLQWHYSCSKEFMNLGFIIAYIFSVDKHKNQNSLLIRKKELQGFVVERVGMRKQNLCVLVQEGGLCKFRARILLQKDSLKIKRYWFFQNTPKNFFVFLRWIIYKSSEVAITQIIPEL